MSKTSIDDEIALFVKHLRGRVDVMVEEELVRMRAEAPAFFTSDDPDFLAVSTASCVGHLGVLLDALSSGRDMPSALPPAAVEETRTVAQWGIPLDSLIHTYRIGHAVVWEHVMDLADQILEDARVRSQILKLISRYFFAYNDRMVVFVVAIYEAERTALFHDRGRRRRQLVRDLLDGLPIDHSKLPYLLSGVHLAAVSTAEECDRILRQLAAQNGLNYLSVPGPTGSFWAWLGGTRLREPDTQAAIMDGLPSGVFVAFGDLAEGLEGFRITHREARQAYRIGRQLSSDKIRYRDVALLSLTTGDEGLAREFMKRELGSLAEDDQRADELRTTLREYFATGHNASVTGARLGLNDRTVAYRLRTVEERLGIPVLARRDELSVALKLFELYGAD